MQSKRHEQHYTIPADPILKLRDREIEMGRHDPYPMSRRDYLQRSPHSRRSLSPRKAEGSRRLLGPPDERGNSVERRDYGWDLDNNGRGGERVRSRSPPFGIVHKRSHYDEGVLSRDLPNRGFGRRYDFVESIDTNAGLKHDYSYDHSGGRMLREKEFDGGRLSGASGHGMLSQKLMVSEDDAGRDSLRFGKDLRPVSKYGEGGGGSILTSSANLDIARLKDERARYLDPLLVDKSSVMESYKERENLMFYSREVSYPQMPGSQSKDFAGTSTGISKGNFQGSYQDGMPLLADEYPRNAAKLPEPLGFGGYGQRSVLDSGRDPNMEHNNLAHYQRDTFSPTRAEYQEYLNSRAGGRDGDDYGYPSDELYARTGAHGRVDYDHKDFLRPGMRDPIIERVHNNEYSYRNLRDSSLLDHPIMQKQTVSSYHGGSVSKGGDYLDAGSAHLEFGRRVSRDKEIPHLDVSRDHEISHFRLDYGFGRDAGPASQNERIRYSPDFKYEAEMRRPVRIQEIEEEEYGTYDSSDRVLKRKYSEEAEMSRHNSRNIMSGKWYNSNRIRDPKDRSEEWTGQDSSISFSSRNAGYDNKLYQRAERTSADRHRDSASEDWLSCDSMEHIEEHSIRPYKPGGRYSRGRLRPGPASSYNSYRFNKRHVLPKPHNVWIRGKDDNLVDVQENEVDQSEDWANSARAEPPEDSEEFKQQVDKAFLIFSKKLNENFGVRRRYKEQGRAGSLFCIVCGRSLSKEFMDTRRLVTHAFMSHKVGLRAQHLGLHKAICVLLGWNSEVAPDVVTWAPDVLAYAEAMAQKEDLILWPPVIIIHNSSIAENNVDEQNVITLDALGDFLRGKGFSGGKFKLCLGKPANHSVILVKFLGTFSGLQDAERLGKYFIENKRGRADFEKVASSSYKAKSSSNNTGVGQGRSVEELVLYGYMGIAEDLDKVDIDTKRKCLIKSKAEVQDLANGPVKPE